MTVNYNQLMVLWQKLDLLQRVVMVAPEDAATTAEIQERDRVFDFLAGLRPEFGEVRGRVLGKEPTP